MDPSPHEAALSTAADAIRSADALLIGAGAGMGVDSGLPDFRGPEGFWRAYPAFRQLGLRFEQLANPAWFIDDPHLAWGFYGHRLNAYRATIPHAGFAVLRRWAESKPAGYFVFTSNVDGQFQKAGFAAERIVECHGSILHLQCTLACTPDIWPAEGLTVEVDPQTFRAADPLPRCRNCAQLARPNILMFGDGGWLGGRTHAQHRRLAEWYRTLAGKRLAVVECGAGTAVPSVRIECESIASRADRDDGSNDAPAATLLRINPREPGVPPGHVALPLGAVAGLQAIDQRLSEGRPII